ncbi:aldehyde dehydrogenase (NAD+)/phenylacetaldehyde dehydrogenase [Gelidibacter algens]|jgi:acyl-CoA reductase-like NAD-dependent aldehyde dehydrogenase|uniref:Aldehyde dehydrogenase (NAD+)/phenylacetaldehyde dehydrogenase n=1 Tax=Gelidibacter algens TaxID=49280 RepID=A0A1A7R153_9FLAO|nr:aldehyde dehydrogenase family protein [Gelidibacter algens]OBX25253.1 betaine-aldehyde dehydrogenase [Gelidibacter algens]RAJ20980.1 aldehyde dehydrogenase (NAD+)/phenylacetaldehyde dehydrogenase [Gelidibacter algens]
MKAKIQHAELSPKTKQFLDTPPRMLIGNEWVKSLSNKTFDTVNPADGKVILQIPLADKRDIDAAVVAARHAFKTTWKDGVSPTQRAELLWDLARLMERDLQVFMELETLDNGKPLSKSKYDVLGAINHLKYYAGWVTKINGSTVPVGSNKLVYTKKEALGVVGLIVPWNFPLMISMWKLAPALACGNCCILKPSELTPLSALYLGHLIIEAGFPAGVVNIVTGEGSPAGEAICHHMDVDMVSFTGSTVVGRKIMEAAAQSNLKKISLELGGKSPNVIFDDADLEKVFENLQWSSFYNTGQECTLGSRIYVQQSIFDKTVANLKEKAEKMTMGNGFDDHDLGPMISEKQLSNVMDYIDSGKKEGAVLVCGGKRIFANLRDGYFLEPTIFTSQSDGLRIVKEEIFGPVVVILPFNDFDDAILKANNSSYGLAAAVWTQDLSKAHNFANKVDAGTVWVNGYDLFDAAVPFGGFKQSGNGKEMGVNAIDQFTKEKAVWIVL